MSTRIVFTGLAAALTVASFGTYTARLYFRNETTGAENVGAVAVSSGDLISCNYSFHRDAGDNSSKWTTLQMFMDLGASGPNSILTDEDANTWDSAILAFFRRPLSPPILLAWQPSDGPIHDNGVDPGDTSSTLITSKGVYALTGINGSASQSHDVDYQGIFTFHVGAGASAGAELHWGLEGRNTDNGITTRIYDNKNKSVGVTDNWLTVVPEPGIPAAGIALLALVGRIRNKERI